MVRGKKNYTVKHWAQLYGLGKVTKEDLKEEVLKEPEVPEKKPYLSYTSVRRKQKSPFVEIQCLKCDKLFESRDIKKNRFCSVCRKVNKKLSQANIILPEPDMEKIIESITGY